jgi:hypothetical protein
MRNLLLLVLLLSSLSFDFRGQSEITACNQIIETIDNRTGQIFLETPILSNKKQYSRKKLRKSIFTKYVGMTIGVVGGVTFSIPVAIAGSAIGLFGLISQDVNLVRETGDFISATKVIEGKNESYYITLNANVHRLNSQEKGVTLLCDNGAALTWPDAEIEVDWKDSGYCYSAIVSLSDLEVEILANTTINSYRLHRNNSSVDSRALSKKQKLTFMAQMRCLSGLSQNKKKNEIHLSKEDDDNDLVDSFKINEKVWYNIDSKRIEATIINVSGERYRIEYLNKKGATKSVNVSSDELIKMD